MTSVLDKSLDEVISSRPKNKRRRNAAKASLVGTPAAAATKAAPRVRNASKTQAQTTPPHSEKIIVSNLPQDVNEAQIKELFTHQIGPTREVTLHYDHSGRSKGVASVLFARSGDGTKAFQQYHNRLIDGKRPMKVEIVLDPSKSHQPSLSQRVGPAPAAGKGATTQSAVRGKKARARGGKKKGTERPNKSAADLDAEMADYTGATTSAA